MSRQQLFVDTPSTGSEFSFSPRRGGQPRVVAVQQERIGPNNEFAIAVLVISIVAIIVCILIVFLVKPCPRGRSGRVEVIVDSQPPAAGGGGAGGAVAKAAAVVSPTAASAASGSAVMEPSSKADFDKAVAKGKSIVMFHASWCGHCQATGPEFRKAAADMKKACPGMNIVMADGDKCRETLGPNGIRGFPTIMAFKDGKAGEEYKGNRTAKSFVDFAEKVC